MDARENTTQARIKKRKELHEGVGGSGDTTYMVVTVETDIVTKIDRWSHIEYFKDKAEAKCWLRWA